MKYLKQFTVILGITLAGEWLNHILPFPVPAGVYGLFLLLLLLCGGILKLEQVENAGNLLLDIMSVMFVPSAVGLMESYHQIQSALVPIVSICVASTLIVMVATGKAAQLIMDLKSKKEAGQS
ncbi:CidA/LrgA family protein [Clostridiaceae bacterium]|nr:CidA/LrgA family protein [Clostridiaceae bacterium]RKI12067.1 CidA/LrgA family protein [bacterium 1XD21-70]